MTLTDLTLAQCMFLGVIVALLYNVTVDAVGGAKDYLVGRRRRLTKPSQTQTTVE